MYVSSSSRVCEHIDIRHPSSQLFRLELSLSKKQLEYRTHRIPVLSDRNLPSSSRHQRFYAACPDPSYYASSDLVRAGWLSLSPIVFWIDEGAVVGSFIRLTDTNVVARAVNLNLSVMPLLPSR
jgi:hypothetical protein